MIAIGGQKHLRFVAQPPEADRVNDPIPIALEAVARATIARFLLMASPAAVRWQRGPWGEIGHARYRSSSRVIF
jgi:hypothetical protein